MKYRKNNDKIRKIKAKIKELLFYKKKIQKISKAKTLKTTLKHSNELKKNLDELPDVIKDYVKKFDKKINLVLEQVKDSNIPKNKQSSRIIF